MMKKLNSAIGVGGKPQQKGAVLVFCLVFLTILTMMGVSGMESTILEERMSGNMRDYTIAFQAAESALKNGEAWLNQQTLLPTTSTDGSTVVWEENSMDPSATDGLYWWDHANINDTWWSNNGNSISGLADVVSQPQYVIEQYRTVDSGESIGEGSGEIPISRDFHRVTARGLGLTGNTEVRLQSTFVRRYE